MPEHAILHTPAKDTVRRDYKRMSRLQDAVDEFANKWLDATGNKPDQDTLYNGTFSRRTGQEFCLCFRNFTGLGQMINFAGLECMYCEKPVTDETYIWGDEARAERAAMKDQAERPITDLP